ncbi:hypothetical protein D3C81_1273980 [compost metagenome]
MVELIGCVDPVGGEEAVEVALAGHRHVQADRVLAAGLGQLQAARLPVAPAAAGRQVAGHLPGQLVSVGPAAQAQQQAGAPLADGVVAQFRVVLAHHLERAGVEAARQGQADFAGDGHLLLAGERQVAAVFLEQAEGLFRVLPRQAAQAETDGVGSVAVAGGEALALLQQFGLLRHLDQQLALAGEAAQGLLQVAGQTIVALLGGQLEALPAHVLGQPALGAPLVEQAVAGVGLRLAGQPQPFGGDGAVGGLAVAELVLAE